MNYVTLGNNGMKLTQWFFLIFFAGFLTACSTSSSNLNTLSGLQSLRAPSSVADDASKQMRTQSLQDTALSVGAQGGLAARAAQINQILNDQSERLDVIFNFNRLMLPDHVLPPVLETSEKSMKLDGVTTIRLSDQVYVIQSQARFVSVAPNWRDYLIMNYKAPDMPPANMLPSSLAEQKIWKKYILIGWKQGLDQGDQILKDNLARITRDFKGMVLYKTLLIQGMVSPPFVDKTPLGVTGGGDSMRINDQVLQITALPRLDVNTRDWHTVSVPAQSTSGNA